LRKPPETAARIIEFIGLRVATSQEDLVQRNSARRLGRDQLVNCGGDLIETAHVRETFAIANK
jgi:hypothetical protein